MSAETPTVSQTETPTWSKAILWRLILTIVILLFLAGPGAELLQTLM